MIKAECDFVAGCGNSWSAYQVSWQLNDMSKGREIKGLTQACQYLNLKKGVILTYDEAGHERVDKIAIEIIPVRKWLCD